MSVANQELAISLVDPVSSDFGDTGATVIVNEKNGRVFTRDISGRIRQVGPDSSYTASGTGAATRTISSKLSDFISVKDFGAACDDSTDDTAAIQAAIDSVGDTSVSSRAGVDILIPGPCVISSTLTIQRKGIRLVGDGWGSRLDTTGTRRSYLRWNGSAGSPMVKFVDCWAGAGVYRLKFNGKTTALPSAAIELNNTNTGVSNQQVTIEKVYIGHFSGETDAGVQFASGIVISGTNQNSEHRIVDSYFFNIDDACIDQGSIQNQNIRVDHCTFLNADVGIRVCGSVTGSNLVFSNCLVDFEQPFTDDASSQTAAFINVHNYYSESAGRMAELIGTSRFSIVGGQFQLTSSANSDGKIIKHEGNLALLLRLQDFKFTQTTSPPTSPFLAMRSSVAGASQRTIILDGITGWANLTGGTNGLDVATRGSTDRTYIFFREHAQAASSSPARVAQNFVTGNGVDWNIARFDIGPGSNVAGTLAALATDATDGFLYVPTCAGTPTGTPTTVTGKAPLVIDTTNNRLYFYSGGAWRDAGP